MVGLYTRLFLCTWFNAGSKVNYFEKNSSVYKETAKGCVK